MIYRKRSWAALAFLLLVQLAVSCAASAGSDGATITYRKVFKTSYPEFTEIKINEAGAGTYELRQLDEDPNPQPLDVGPAFARQLFDLAARLHNFDGVDLEIHHRIANLGEKTFTYERGAEVHRVTFNYTLDENAAQLLLLFDNLARQEGDLSDLVRAMRYDRLGVNDVLRRIQVDYDKKLLPTPELLLPALDQAAADAHFIDIARQLARTLAGRIRSGH